MVSQMSRAKVKFLVSEPTVEATDECSSWHFHGDSMWLTVHNCGIVGMVSGLGVSWIHYRNVDGGNSGFGRVGHGCLL